jgi:hypothetical protein
MVFSGAANMVFFGAANSASQMHAPVVELIATLFPSKLKSVEVTTPCCLSTMGDAGGMETSQS